jgi:glutamine synthetase type III
LERLDIDHQVFAPPFTAEMVVFVTELVGELRIHRPHVVVGQQFEHRKVGSKNSVHEPRTVWATTASALRIVAFSL